MHVQDIFKRQRTTFSFELFPPKTAAEDDQVLGAVAELESLCPSFISVTYGAGGSTRQRTQDLVLRIKSETTCDPVPHLTCVMHNSGELQSILETYADNGISNINALAGDVPRSAAGYDRSRDEFRYAADLVAFIKKFNDSGRHPDPRGFGIGVAGYPEGHHLTPNRLTEMDYLKAKVDAGADVIVTQLFFDNRDFYDFRERCSLAGIHVPIVAGIMPITSLKGLERMAGLALGTRFPARLLKAVDRAQGDPEGVRRVGVHWATEQCLDLLDMGVDGLHFYTLNRSTATREVYASLGVKDSRDLFPRSAQAVETAASGRMPSA